MRFRKENNNYILRLEYGEELVTALTAFVKVHKIKGAWISGLGGALDATLGIYRIDSDKEYHWHEFAGPLEVTNLTGNVAMIDQEPKLHLHATISGVDMNASGGHVKELTVAGTLELLITELRPIQRVVDDEIGLGLMDLDG